MKRPTILSKTISKILKNKNKFIVIYLQNQYQKLYINLISNRITYFEKNIKSPMYILYFNWKTAFNNKDLI